MSRPTQLALLAWILGMVALAIGVTRPRPEAEPAQISAPDADLPAADAVAEPGKKDRPNNLPIEYSALP